MGIGKDRVGDESKAKDEEMQVEEGAAVSDMEEEDEMVQIDPLQSLFDRTSHSSLAENVSYMQQKYDFFIPDNEYLEDLEGFLGYCSEKIKIGYTCLYCQKGFATYRDTQRHMIDQGHCKICYEEGVDVHEYECFYDFQDANAEFLGTNEKSVGADDNDSSGEWTDVDEGEDDNRDEYMDFVKTHGFGVTEFGELILPGGRIIGHRAFSKYYNQNFAPTVTNKAVMAQKTVERERIFGYGRTFASDENSNALVAGGRTLQARGREGKGILVKAAGASDFTKVSLYRYRAALTKSRMEEAQCFRRRMRTEININKLNKKGNRLVNNVSVAHAKR